MEKKWTKEIRKMVKFKLLSKPLIKFLNDNFNPHTKIIIDTASAEIVSGEFIFYTKKYIKD